MAAKIKKAGETIFMNRERIHPSAIISSEAEIAGDVLIGAFAVIEGKVQIGSGCVLRPFTHLNGPLSLGQGNQIYAGAVLGEQPQHARFEGETSSVQIGDQNVFGEQVTVHRGTTQPTRIGTRNVFMANSHVGHDCRIGDGCFLDCNAVVGGHCILENDVQLRGNSGVHQFVRLGRLSVLETTSVATKDLPPFAISRGTNIVCGLNVAGMQEAGHSAAEIETASQVFEILYQQKNTLRMALEKIDRELSEIPIAQEVTTFIRNSTRGIVLGNRFVSGPD
jgi:UDP-N-acetylglucosamine acyltransferase